VAGDREAFVGGLAFWSTRLPGWDVAAPVLRGECPAPTTPSSRPVPSLLAPTERRRAPDTVAVALEVAAAACRSAGIDPASTPSVFASTHGDLTINDYMSRTLAETPALISPIRFHNSVHNAAAGYWTIATGCHEPYTALTAFNDTFGEGLLEALSQAACDDRPVLFVAYDIEARGALASIVPSRGVVGAAMVVSPRRERGSMLQLHWWTSGRQEATPATPANASLLQDNSMTSCLPFFEAVACRRPGTIAMSLSPSASLEVDLDFLAPANDPG
jgi:hypothetical protein